MAESVTLTFLFSLGLVGFFLPISTAIFAT
jgi:hypothetical protein